VGEKEVFLAYRFALQYYRSKVSSRSKLLSTSVTKFGDPRGAASTFPICPFRDDSSGGRWTKEYGRTRHWLARTISLNSWHMKSTCLLMLWWGPREAASLSWARGQLAELELPLRHGAIAPRVKGLHGVGCWMYWRDKMGLGDECKGLKTTTCQNTTLPQQP
jgi:hypothetical protein